jgi:lambda family phage portal protein
MRFGDRMLRVMGLQRIESRPPSRRASFAGGQVNRLNGDFLPMIMSPNQEVQWNNWILRARARDLVKNNSYAAGFVNELANNVIGPDGILLQAKVKNANGRLAKATNAEIERGWKEWGMPENACVDGHDTWDDLTRLMIKTIATDGEVFLRKIRYFDNPFAFSLQLLDADLVDSNYNVPAKDGGNEIRMGVELNKWGRPVAYHVLTRHPSEFLVGPPNRVPIPADEIIHRFIRYRPGQVRGITWFAPVLLELHNLDGYESSELHAARLAAAKMGFIKNTSEVAVASWDWETQSKKEPKSFDAEGGLIAELLPGQEFESYDPTHPSSAYKEFTKAVLRAVARGLNMAYTTLTGDLEAVNYSSIRAGLLSERDHFRTLQRWFGVHICRNIYREWLAMALLAGAIRVDSRLASNYYEVEWKPRGWKWVDPVNDLTAAALAISLGLDSRSRLASEQGRDFEEIVDELAHELEVADEAGVDISGAGAAPTSAQTVDTNGPTSGNPTPNDNTSNADDENPRRLSHRGRRIQALRLALETLERMERAA